MTELGRETRRLTGLRRVRLRPSAALAQEPAGGAARRGADARTDLLGEYRRTRSVALRNQLVERYRSFVEGMARILVSRLPRSVDVQDLAHAGIWGLLQAIESFEPARGTHFVPFMRIRVRGAMIDELRNMDFVPRMFRQRQRLCEETREQLRQQLGRDPADAELALALGVSEETLRRTYDVGLPRLLSETGRDPDRETGDGEPAAVVDGLTDEDHEPPIELLFRRELLERIEQSLDPNEWSVLRLHYLEGLSGKQVAARLGVTPARICQIHLQVLSRLKERLAEIVRA
jgi:RNA polymerase sigma factor for flagellar operon FliA